MTTFAWTSKRILPNYEGGEDARKWQTQEVREVASLKILSSDTLALLMC